jgi:hypothetical protein
VLPYFKGATYGDEEERGKAGFALGSARSEYVGEG